MLRRFAVAVPAVPMTGTAQAAGSGEDFYSITMGGYWVNGQLDVRSCYANVG